MRLGTALLAVILLLVSRYTNVSPSPRPSAGEVDSIYNIKVPDGYRNWRLISVAHEEGTLNDIRAVLGT